MNPFSGRIILFESCLAANDAMTFNTDTPKDDAGNPRLYLLKIVLPTTAFILPQYLLS